MKHSKISNFFIICLVALSTAIFAMESEKQKEFVFNKKNYLFGRTSKNKKFFVGILKKSNKKTVHAVKMSDNTLYFGFDLNNFATYLSCSPNGRYIAIGLGLLTENVSIQIWDIYSRKCIFEDAKPLERVLFGSSGKYVALIINPTENPAYRKYGCDILMCDLENGKYVAKYVNCLDDAIPLHDYYDRFFLFKQRGISKKVYESFRGQEFFGKIDVSLVNKKWSTVLFDLNKGNEFDRLTCEKRDATSQLPTNEWFSNKSIRIAFEESKFRDVFVLTGGRTLQKKLSEKKSPTNKPYSDVCVICQDGRSTQTEVFSGLEKQ